MRSRMHLVILGLLICVSIAHADDPIVITGPEQKQFNRDLPDGGLLPAPGVTAIVRRAARKRYAVD